MNIELYLENRKVEVEKVDFPLNKTFQNLTNPTDIVADYSKTISIPMTKQNNKVLGNAYRLDKIILSSDKENIGMYLDPTKKIPFRLMYNGDLLMEGYAKFNNAMYSAKKKCYNMTLFGTIGDIFQKMKEVVVDENKLPAGLGKEYVLNDHLSGNSLTPRFVANCFEHFYTYKPLSDWSGDDDIIGFAPMYRGLYADFKSNKIQISASETKDLADYINEKIRPTYLANHYRRVGETEEAYQERMTKEIEALGFNDLVGDGFKDYQMGEYRMNQQKPTLYIHNLFSMFQEKMKELTGYDLVIDDLWANETNPYWTRMCYMMNYLSDSTHSQQSASIFAPASTSQYSTASRETSVSTTTKDISSLDGSGDIVINPHSISVNARFDSRTTYDDGITSVKLSSYPQSTAKMTTAIYCDISWTLKNGTVKHAYYWTCSAGPKFPSGDINYASANYIQPVIRSDQSRKETIHHVEIPIPVLDLGGDVDTNKPLTYTITSKVLGEGGYPFSHFYHLEWWTHPEHHEGRPGDQDFDPVGHDAYEDIVANSADFYTGVSELSANVSWRNDIRIKLKTFYGEDRPIFDLLLEYTKMFGLIWDCDDITRKVYIKTRRSYFKDSTIEDWTDRVDKSKDFIIEPVSFDNKYVNFNYESVQGNNYTDYEDKYGVPYGQKTLKTSYEFNNESKDLFKGIKPSCVSTKSFTTLKDILSWDTKGPIPRTSDVIERIDADTEDEKGAINLNNWYLRGNSTTVYDTNAEDIYITADTQHQLENEFCWIDKDYAATLPEDQAVYINSLPNYNVIWKKGSEYYGSLFNRPNTDYTKSKEITKAGNHYIYDYCWKDYINERYSVQNKKLTCYLDFTGADWMDFKFNHLMKIDNQIFMVNKIFDFNPNNKATTKVELIQVTDISAYNKAGYLTDIVADTTSIKIKDDPYGTAYVIVYGYPVITGDDVTIEYSGSVGSVYTEDWESLDDGGQGIAFTFDGFDQKVGVYKGNIVFNNGIDELKIPFEVETTYTKAIVATPDPLVIKKVDDTTPYTATIDLQSTPICDSVHLEDSVATYKGSARIIGTEVIGNDILRVSIRFQDFHKNNEQYEGDLVVTNGRLNQRFKIYFDGSGLLQ